MTQDDIDIIGKNVKDKKTGKYSYVPGLVNEDPQYQAGFFQAEGQDIIVTKKPKENGIEYVVSIRKGSDFTTVVEDTHLVEGYAEDAAEGEDRVQHPSVLQYLRKNNNADRFLQMYCEYVGIQREPVVTDEGEAATDSEVEETKAKIFG